MSAREVVGRLGTALLTEEATEDDAARVLVALGGPVPGPADPSATPDAATPDATGPDAAAAGGVPAVGAPAVTLGVGSTDLAPTGVWVDPDELARAASPAGATGEREEGEDRSAPAPATAAATADETDLELTEAAAEAAVLHAEARRYPEPEPGSGRRRRRPGADPLLPRTGATATASSSASAASAATGGYGTSGGPRATAVPRDPEELAARLVGATETVEGTVQQPAARPVVAVLLVSTGETIEVRGDVVVGRAPQPLPGIPPQRAAATRLVAVPSPTHMVSRSHLALTTTGANVLAQDLGSSNGTVLVRDGISPVLLATALPTPLLVGDLLDVGDGVTLRVAPPR